MNARKITFTLLAAALLAVPAVTTAQGGPGGPGSGNCGFFDGGNRHGGFGQGKMLGRFADKLDLSDEQRTQIEDIFAASREANQDLHDQMQALHEDFGEINDPAAFDETAARAFAQSLSEVRAELMVRRMKTHTDVWNVLTTEQQEKLKELMDFFGDHPRRGGRRGGPGNH